MLIPISMMLGTPSPIKDVIDREYYKTNGTLISDVTKTDVNNIKHTPTDIYYELLDNTKDIKRLKVQI